MEGKSVSQLLLISIVLGLFVAGGESSSFGCYAGCLSKCVIFKGPIAECVPICNLKCHHADAPSPSSPTSISPDEIEKHYNCHFGCVFSSCINISANNDFAAEKEKVTKCVDSCSDSCIMASKPREVGV